MTTHSITRRYVATGIMSSLVLLLLIANVEGKPKVITGPAELTNQRFALREWKKSTTLDLRQSLIRYNLDGPFHDLGPDGPFPTREELAAIPRTHFLTRFPILIDNETSRHKLTVLGGVFQSDIPRDIPYRMVKSVYTGDAIHARTSGKVIIDGSFIDNPEDALSFRAETDWVVKNVWAQNVRDDFIENDMLLSGQIDNSLVDGTLTFLSNRPGRNYAAELAQDLDFEPPHVTITDTLVHLKSLPWDEDFQGRVTPYNVDGTAVGLAFKWSEWGGTVEMVDSMILMDATPINGPATIVFPEGSYENVTLIWRGEGDFPVAVPDGITVTSDLNVWETARSQWIDAYFARVEDWGAPLTLDAISGANSVIDPGQLAVAFRSAPFHALAAVPEPSTFILAGLGLLSLGMIGRRRRRR